jgi:hypothetical protein
LPFFGIIGSIGLLMKKNGQTCIYYLLLAIIQMIHTLFYKKAKEVYGAGTEVMPTLVIVCGVCYGFLL